MLCWAHREGGDPVAPSMHERLVRRRYGGRLRGPDGRRRAGGGRALGDTGRGGSRRPVRGFDLLSELGRLRLIAALLGGELCVCDPAAVTGTSESATSHALRILRAHRAVTVRRSSRMAYYSLADDHVGPLAEVALGRMAHAVPAQRPGSAAPTDRCFIVACLRLDRHGEFPQGFRPRAGRPQKGSLGFPAGDTPGQTTYRVGTSR